MQPQSNPLSGPCAARISLFLLAFLGFGLHALADTPSLDSVLRMIRAERWTKAIDALERITAAEPENGPGWFYLAYSHHNAGDLRAALRIGAKAAEFPDLRATSFYNMACAHSVLGELEPAAECLRKSRLAGYTDFDLLESDPELENLRSKLDLKLPAEHEYKELKGRNRIVIPYRVLLPADFDAEKEYSIAVSFAQGGGGKRSTDWCIDELWGGRSTRTDWIVVCAVAPENGWVNHPSHHALEDLFKQLRKDYSVVSNRFHLVGLGGGARVATTYSRMSRAYTASLTVVSANYFGGWEASDFRSMKKVPVHQLVGSEAAWLVEGARTAEAGFEKYSVRTRVTVADGDGVLLESLRAGRLLDLVALGIELD